MGMSYDPTLLKPGSGTNGSTSPLSGTWVGGTAWRQATAARFSHVPVPALMPAPSLTVPDPTGTPAGVGEQATVARTRRHASSTGSALYWDVRNHCTILGRAVVTAGAAALGQPPAAPVTNSPGVGGRGTGFGAAGGDFRWRYFRRWAERGRWSRWYGRSSWPLGE